MATAKELSIALNQSLQQTYYDLKFNRYGDAAKKDANGKWDLDIKKCVENKRKNMDPVYFKRSVRQKTGVDDRISLSDARASLVAYKAELKKLELEEKKGILVDRAAYDKKIFSTYRAIRDAILNVPYRISGELAATDDQTRCEKILSDALNDCLPE